jgi:hypothetical protein
MGLPKLSQKTAEDFKKKYRAYAEDQAAVRVHHLACLVCCQ